MTAPWSSSARASFRQVAINTYEANAKHRNFVLVYERMPEALLLAQPAMVADPLRAAGISVLERADVAGALDDPAALRTVQVLVMSGTLHVPVELLEALPALRLIAVHGVGYDGVPLDHCRARGIAVSNTPDVLTDDVADLALALVLMTLRRLGEGERFLRAGRWEQGKPPLGTALAGRTAGIVGLGRIGKALALRLEACGMRITYHGRVEQPVPYAYHADLHALARAADVLVVLVPGGAATQHLIDATVLDALGPQGSLVNVARGSVVDQEALIVALQEKRIAAAGLDVFAQEPQVPEALRQLENVVLLPHLGSATTATRQAMAELVVRNVLAFVNGNALPTPVNT